MGFFTTNVKHKDNSEPKKLMNTRKNAMRMPRIVIRVDNSRYITGFTRNGEFMYSYKIAKAKRYNIEDAKRKINKYLSCLGDVELVNPKTHEVIE